MAPPDQIIVTQNVTRQANFQILAEICIFESYRLRSLTPLKLTTFAGKPSLPLKFSLNLQYKFHCFRRSTTLYMGLFSELVTQNVTQSYPTVVSFSLPDVGLKEEPTMENATLSTQVNSLNNNICTAIDALNKALADLSGIATAVGKLGEISALLGSVGPIVAPVKAKRTRRTRAEIEAEKAAKGAATAA